MTEEKKEEEKKPVSELELYYLMVAHSKGEITFKQWITQAKEWALLILKKHKTTTQQEDTIEQQKS